MIGCSVIAFAEAESTCSGSMVPPRLKTLIVEMDSFVTFIPAEASADRSSLYNPCCEIFTFAKGPVNCTVLGVIFANPDCFEISHAFVSL